MKFFTLILALSILLSSCAKKAYLTLEVQNDTLFVDDGNPNSVNVIRYKVYNRSNETYYFNNLREGDNLYMEGIYKNGRVIKIFDNNGQEVRYQDKIYKNRLSLEDQNLVFKEITTKLVAESERLGYNEVKRYFISEGGYSNFFIHPKETLFFEYYINITDTMSPEENFRLKYPLLNPRKKYHAKLFIASDTANVQENLPREILKTIKENNVKIYHGVLESNIIPIKLIHN